MLLFADTFNNYYHPETAKAAVEVLEDAGFHVEVPKADLCCGRPLYDYGFLGMARRWLENMLIEAAAVHSGRACRWWCLSQVAGRCSRMN